MHDVGRAAGPESRAIPMMVACCGSGTTLKSKKRVRKVTLLLSGPPYPNGMIRPLLIIALRIVPCSLVIPYGA